MVRQERYEERWNVQGGEGPVRFYHIEEKEELFGHARLYARIELPKGSSIGWHIHERETEPYCILAGEGTFTDSDGSVHKVHAGDCCIIEPGSGHALVNEADEDLVFIALIHSA